MRRALSGSLLLLLLSLSANPRAEAATSPEAATGISPPNRIAVDITPANPRVDDVVTVSVMVTGKVIVDDGLTPSFSNLTLLYAQQPVRDEVELEGTKVPSRTWHYYLLPEREGQTTVGAITARWQGGSSAQSEARTFKIGPREQQDPIDSKAAQALMRDDGSMTVRVAPDQVRVRVGQPLVITAQVFSGGKEAVVEKTLRSFSVGGVTVSQGEKPETSHLGDGAADSMTLIPLEAGTLQIGAMTVLVKVVEEAHVSLKVLRSRPFAVQVVAPPAGAPEGFDPANIGRFELTTRLTDALGAETTAAETGQNITLEVRVKGDGPVGEVRLMVAEEHPFFVITPAPMTSDLESPEPHVRLFRYTLTPILPGTYDSPEVAMAYYDPEAEWYRTTTVPGRTLEVTGDPLVSDDVALPVRASLGGLTLGDTRRQAFRVETGWPGLRLTSVQPVTGAIDLSPQIAVTWGHGLEVGAIGLEAGFELRATLWQRGPHAIGLLSESAFMAQIPLDGTAGAFGGRIGLGVMWGMQLRNDLAVNAGVRLHPTLLSAGELAFRMPVLLGSSIEYLLLQNAEATMNLTVSLNAGPDFCLTGSCAGLTAALDMGFGVSVSW